MEISSVIFTSVVVSAAVSGAFSLFGQFANQWLTSRAKQRELVFNAAIDLAKERRKLLLETAKEQNAHVNLLPDVYTTAEIYQSLQHIFEKGELDRATRMSIDLQAEISDSLHAQGIHDPDVIYKAIEKAQNELSSNKRKSIWSWLFGK